MKLLLLNHIKSIPLLYTLGLESSFGKLNLKCVKVEGSVSWTELIGRVHQMLIWVNEYIFSMFPCIILCDFETKNIDITHKIKVKFIVEQQTPHIQQTGQGKTNNADKTKSKETKTPFFFGLALPYKN